MRLRSARMLLPGVLVLFLLLLKAPALYDAWQINRFTMEIVQVWTPLAVEAGAEKCGTAAAPDALSRLEKIAGESSRALWRQGAYECLQGNPAAAAAVWEQAVSAEPPDPVAALDLALLRFGEGEIVETRFARDIGAFGYNRGLEARRNDDPAAATEWYAFSLAYSRSIFAANQLAGLLRSGSDAQQVADFWIEVSETAPAESALHWWARGQAAAGDRDWPAAAENYERSAAAATADGETYVAAIEAGISWYRAGAFDRAQAPLRDALALGLRYNTVDFDGQEPYLWLGRAAYAQGRFAEAEDFFDSGLRLAPDNALFLYEKALALDGQGRRAEAAALLSDAIDTHANPPAAWVSLLDEWTE